MNAPKAPENCNSMAELRREIDAIDVSLIEMLARRTNYIDRAVELKPAEGLPARTVDRVAEVLRNVRENAEKAGWDPDIAETIWAELIEWSILRESKHLGS